MKTKSEIEAKLVEIQQEKTKLSQQMQSEETKFANYVLNSFEEALKWVIKK